MRVSSVLTAFLVCLSDTARYGPTPAGIAGLRHNERHKADITACVPLPPPASTAPAFSCLLPAMKGCPSAVLILSAVLAYLSVVSPDTVPRHEQPTTTPPATRAASLEGGWGCFAAAAIGAATKYPVLRACHVGSFPLQNLESRLIPKASASNIRDAAFERTKSERTRPHGNKVSAGSWIVPSTFGL